MRTVESWSSTWKQWTFAQGPCHPHRPISALLSILPARHWPCWSMSTRPAQGREGDPRPPFHVATWRACSGSRPPTLFMPFLGWAGGQKACSSKTSHGTEPGCPVPGDSSGKPLGGGGVLALSQLPHWVRAASQEGCCLSPLCDLCLRLSLPSHSDLTSLRGLWGNDGGSPASSEDLFLPDCAHKSCRSGKSQQLCMCACVRMHMHAYKCVHVLVCRCVCTPMRVSCMHTCLYTCVRAQVHVCACVLSEGSKGWVQRALQGEPRVSMEGQDQGHPSREQGPIPMCHHSELWQKHGPWVPQPLGLRALVPSVLWQIVQGDRGAGGWWAAPAD